MKAELETLRWADLRAVQVAIGQATRIEVFRVTAPFPCVWKVFFAARAAAPGNFPLTLRAVFMIGVGSFTAEGPQDIAFNQTYLAEIPAQSLALVFVADPALAADTFQFGGTAAPMTAFKHLEVKVQRG